MAIELECGICGQEHRFRDEHAGRQARCKECSARIDIPRGGLGGILDGTTPVFTPPMILVGSFVLVAVMVIGLWEIIGSLGQSVPPRQVAPSASSPRMPSLATVTPSSSSLPTADQSTAAQPTTPIAVPIVPSVPVDRTLSPSGSLNVPNARSSTRRPANTDEMARIRESYEHRRTPLVSFTTPDNQPVQIREISPTWAEPGQPLVLRGQGLATTSQVLAIDNVRFREHELTFRVVSDSELEVSAPPDCEKRNECVFVFEVYTPKGVAVTLPRELVDAGDTVLVEFAIVRRQPISVAGATFALVDESGSIKTVNNTRIYLLTPTQPQAFYGVVTKVFRTEQSKIDRVEGAKIEAVTVPAIFPCHLDRLFVGPDCRVRRLLLQ